MKIKITKGAHKRGWSDGYWERAEVTIDVGDKVQDHPDTRRDLIVDECILRQIPTREGSDEPTVVAVRQVYKGSGTPRSHWLIMGGNPLNGYKIPC